MWQCSQEVKFGENADSTPLFSYFSLLLKKNVQKGAWSIWPRGKYATAQDVDPEVRQCCSIHWEQ